MYAEPDFRRAARAAATGARRALRSAAWLALTLAALCPAPAARAQDPGDFALALGVGALGATVDTSYRITKSLGLRVPAGFAGAEFDRADDPHAAEDRALPGSLGLLADYFPGAGSGHGAVRLSGGAIIGTDAAGAPGRGSAAAALGSGGGRLLPVVSLGYNGTVGDHWAVAADLGALYTGETGIGAAPHLPPGSRDGDVESAALVPYLQLSVAFRF